MKSIADLVNDLFAVHRRPDGKEYTNAEVSRALHGALDASYLGKMRQGKGENPSRETLLLLCRFFQVPPSYFFPELDLPDPAEPGGATDDATLLAALRTTGLSPDVQQSIYDLIRKLRKDHGHEDTNR